MKEVKMEEMESKKRTWVQCRRENIHVAVLCRIKGFDRHSCIYEVHMSPALNRSSAIWRFERSNATEIHDRITFDFCAV